MGELSITENPDPAFLNWVRIGIAQENAAKGLPDEAPRPLNVFHIEDDKLVGGLLGQTRWNLFVIVSLFVTKEQRGRGIGSTLLKAAEAEACKRGCIGARVTTSSLEAPNFYRDQGYVIRGQIDRFPNGSSMYLLDKPLEPNFMKQEQHEGCQP